MAIDKFIQAGSPFKVFYPSDDYVIETENMTEAILNVWIYSGLQGDSNTFVGGNNVDASIAGESGDRTNAPTRTLKSTAVGSVGGRFVSFDIANLVKSKLKQEFQGTSLISSVSNNPSTMVWVDYQLITKRGEVQSIHPLQNCLGFDGYTYFEEGVNAQVPDGALISANTISVVEGEELVIPVLLEGLNSVTFYNNSEGVVTPSTAITIASSTSSYDQIKYTGAIGVDSVQIITDDLTRTIKINTLECNKHTPYKLSFLNRFGAVESLWFNGNNTESTMAKSKEYGRVNTSSANGSEYNISRASRYKQRMASNKAMSLNSGFYPEGCNSSFEELIDSTEVWIEKDGLVLPVNIKNSSFNKKTELNDNAINYTINIEYAFNKINNI